MPLLDPTRRRLDNALLCSPWSTSTRPASEPPAISTSTLPGRTTVRVFALWRNDYAGQDPINGYDLSGLSAEPGEGDGEFGALTPIGETPEEAEWQAQEAAAERENFNGAVDRMEEESDGEGRERTARGGTSQFKADFRRLVNARTIKGWWSIRTPYGRGRVYELTGGQYVTVRFRTSTPGVRSIMINGGGRIINFHYGR